VDDAVAVPEPKATVVVDLDRVAALVDEPMVVPAQQIRLSRLVSPPCAQWRR
jgi:hypothetical protein